MMGFTNNKKTIHTKCRTWDSYFSSYLQVVHQQSISQAGFISNIYTIASCTWGPIVG